MNTERIIIYMVSTYHMVSLVTNVTFTLLKHFYLEAPHKYVANRH